MRASLFGYFFGMIVVLSAALVVLSGLSNISTTFGSGRHYPPPPVIGRTVMVETQRHAPPAAKKALPAKSVAKEALLAKDVSPVVATAKVETKKSKHYKSKVIARQRNNNGYGIALGYAQESGYAPRSPFFQ